MNQIRSVYLASPEGFASGHKPYLDAVKKHLREVCKVEVWDPWEQDYLEDFRALDIVKDYDERLRQHRILATKIGFVNHGGILNRDAVLGICDGAQVDDGTASEMGFAAGCGKRVYALRTDFRDVGDLLGVPINLQVLYWVERSGGKLFRKIQDINLALPFKY